MRFVRTLTLVTVVAVVSCAGWANSVSAQSQVATSGKTFEVGSKVWPLEKHTATGAPVVGMWKVDTAKRLAAYPALKAEHHLVWSPADRAEGGYNHYSCLIRYKKTLFAMWGNQPYGEDEPGQQVLYSVSDKWGVWSKPRVLFAPPGPVERAPAKGIHLKPDRWVNVDGELYAIVSVQGAGRYPIARRLEPNGAMGDSFLLEKLPEGGKLPSYMHDATPPAISKKLLDWYPVHDEVSWWAAKDEGVQRTAIDGAKLIETFMYRAKDDTFVLMARDWGTPSNPVQNNRVYVSFSKEYGHWGKAYPTDIPDAPTRGNAVRLDNGTILLIGTNYAPQLDMGLYLNRDPLTIAVSKDGFTFDRAYSLRAGAPTKWHIPNVKGRNPGFAYTSSIVDDGYLYTLYSIGKEDIAISRVPLSELEK